jgi:hypothetical protein
MFHSATNHISVYLFDYPANRMAVPSKSDAKEYRKMGGFFSVLQGGRGWRSSGRGWRYDLCLPFG